MSNMGSLQLDCPLCCSETFSCHNSLKYHLLSITDNLICPACNKRFEKIFDLAMHIGNNCIDVVEKVDKDEIEANAQYNNVEERAGVIKNLKEELIAQTNTTDLVSNSSILAKALMKNSNEAEESIKLSLDNTDLNEDVSENDLYYCSSCRIKFVSIEEHLDQFHQGHEVFVEENKDESQHNSPENCEILEFADENDSENLAANNSSGEECIDKDGLLYTRKLVKIEKFWDIREINEGTQNEVLINTDSDDFLTENANAENGRCYQKCKLCNSCFVNAKYLDAHMLSMHNAIYNLKQEPQEPNAGYVCEICNTEFVAYKSLRLHKRMHEPIKAKDIDPPVSYSMQGEELKEESSPRQMFTCEICNKPYHKEYEEIHKKYHSKEMDFNCEVCNRKFYTQANLEMHMRAHIDAKKFTCSYCKKGFLTNEKLEAHMETMCQKRQYECQYCGRRFARPHEKVKHERIHTGEKPHICEICGKAFRVSYCLTLHLRTHSGSRPYKCEHCGKRFKAHSVYNHHLLTHSDDRKYKCPFCPKTFKTGVQLAGHKNSHTKPFTCNICNRPFASLYAVRAHMETHQRENNLKYKCWDCGASYARAFALRDHIREQHGNKQGPVQKTEPIILDSEDFSIGGNIEESSAILNTDESMLIGIEPDDVNIEMVEVQIAPALKMI